jgi:hypothetical protein
VNPRRIRPFFADRELGRGHPQSVLALRAAILDRYRRAN